MKAYKYIISLIIAISVSINLMAESLHLELNFPKGTDLSEIEFYIAAEGGKAADAQKMERSGTRVVADVDEAPLGFYMLTSVIQGGQVNTPLYVIKGTAKKALKAEMADSYFPVITNDDNCKALSEFGHIQGMLSRKLWMEVKTEEDAKAMLSGYKNLVAEADPKGKAADIVKRYLDVWSYTTTYMNVSNMPQILRKKPKEVTFKPSDILPAAQSVMDNEFAEYMNSSTYIICDDLSKLTTLDEKISAVRTGYKTESIRQKAEKSLLENYISNFNYQKNYAEGLKEISELTAKYDLPEMYVADFQKRSSALSGAAFPEGVNLVDKDGNKMDFSQFRGKYVYVDFWASWCVPCCKEVPHLQALEAELDNPNVVFLSISIDSSKEPWLKKMKDLNMHGNQWLNADNKVCEALNINGVPHFAIYNKEGKLMVNDADRPSSGDELKNFLKMLK